MTDLECAEHLQRLKMGINIINAFVPDTDKDTIDIEAIDYAIARLQENKE